MTEKLKRVYDGFVRCHQVYTNSTRTHAIGKNCSFPEYQSTNAFSFSKFLTGLEGKHVRLTLEVLK